MSAVLALDLGQSCGWAMKLPDDTVVSGTEIFKPSRFESHGMTYLRFRAWLAELHASTPLATIFFEEVRAHRGVSAAHAYGAFAGILTSWAEECGVPYLAVPVSHIKRHVAAKGNSSKEAVMAGVRKLKFNPQTFDEADALALLDWAFYNRQSPIKGANQNPQRTTP